MKVPFLTERHIRRAVDALLTNALGSADPVLPVDLDDIVFGHLCEHHDLRFSDEEVLSRHGTRGELGRTELVAGRILVCADLKARDIRRYRFTLAHEIGHWVLHRPLLADAQARGQLFDSEWTSTSTESSGFAVTNVSDAERQANIFASHLLLPRASLRTEFGKRFGAEPLVCPTTTAMRAYTRALATTGAAGSDPLADVFQASAEATAIALEESGLVTDQPLLL